MARKKKKKCPPLALWLVTFSDLVTLLLTFFVLLLSMASMDQSFITRVSVKPRDLGMLEFKGAGKISIALQAVLAMIEDPDDLLNKQERLKDLLFPDEKLPNEISDSTLNDNLDVIAKDDGVALVLTDKLLFPRGGSTLDAAAQQLLGQIVPLIGYVGEPVRISAYTDNEEPDPFTLSTDRCLAVLSYLVKNGIRNESLSIAPYGANKPRYNNNTPQGQAKNRRVEILIRSNRPLAGYL